MCMTAAAQNLLSLKLAASLGIVIASPWLTWFKAACVPAIVGLAVTPLLVFKLFPPEIQARSMHTLVPVRPRRRGERRS